MRSVPARASTWNGASLSRVLLRGPVVLTVTLVAVNFLVTAQSNLSQLATALTYAIAASGLGLALGLGGEYILAQGSLFACSAYTTAILIANHGWNYWLAAVAGIVSALILGLVLSVPGLRVSRFYLAMVGFFLVNLTPDIIQVLSKETGGSAGLPLPSAPTFFGHMLSTHGIYVLSSICLIVCLLLLQNVRDSPFGTHLRRMRDDPFVVALSGVRPWKVRLTTYVLTALLAGVGGAIYSEIDGYIAPYDFDITFTILLFAAVVVGGQTSLMGPTLGMFLLFVIPRMIIDIPGVSDFVYGATVLAAVILLRDGVEQGVRDLYVWIRRRTRPSPGNGGAPASRPASPERLSELLWSVREEGFVRRSLTVAGAQKAYGGNAALAMDEGTGLTVKPGQVHLLLGPNGSGKTTLLNTMCGLARVDHGTVTVGERDVTHARPATIANLGVARSYQAPRLPAELTPHELVAGMLAHMRAIGSPHWLLNDPKAIRVRRQSGQLADEIIAAAGLEQAGNEPNRNLTSGQRRILDVLMALTSQASIVLLDEPAAGLSGDERRALGATITSLAGRGMAFLVVEHDLELGFSLADEVTVLAGGRIVAQGDAPTIREHALAREALMGAAAA